MKKLFYLYCLFNFLGCIHTNSYADFYTSLIPKDEIRYKDWVVKNKPIFLKENERTHIQTVSDIKQSLREYRSNNYLILGYSAFSGSLGSYYDLLEFAEDLGATVVLKQDPKYMHSTTTGGGVFTNPVTGAISGGAVHTYHRYEQNAYFLVKSRRLIKGIGFEYSDLSEKQRSKYKKNTGVIVNLVFKDTPAFYSNLIRNDIILEYNSIKINNSKQLLTAVNKHYKTAGTAKVIILRDGVKQKIYVNLSKDIKTSIDESKRAVVKSRQLASISRIENKFNVIGEGKVKKVKNGKILLSFNQPTQSMSRGDKIFLINGSEEFIGKAEFSKFSKKRNKAVLKFDGAIKKNTKVYLSSKRRLSTSHYVTSGLIGSFVGFGTGHLVQGRYWDKGWIFTLASASIVGSGALLAVAEYNLIPLATEIIAISILATSAGIKLWEVFDIWKLPPSYEVASKNLELSPFFFAHNDTPYIGLSLNWKY